MTTPGNKVCVKPKTKFTIYYFIVHSQKLQVVNLIDFQQRCTFYQVVTSLLQSDRMCYFQAFYNLYKACG